MEKLLSDILTPEQISQVENFVGSLLLQPIGNVMIFESACSSGKNTVAKLIASTLGDKAARVPVETMEPWSPNHDLLPSTGTLLVMDEFLDGSKFDPQTLERLLQNYSLLLIANFEFPLEAGQRIFFSRRLPGSLSEFRFPDSDELEAWKEHCRIVAETTVPVF